MPTPSIDITLDEALRETAEHRWRGMRSEKRNYSQASIAIQALKTHCGLSRVGEIDGRSLKKVTSLWLSEGVAPGTVNGRLNCLSALGATVNGSRVRQPRPLKWWLSPQAEEQVCAFLARDPKFYQLSVLVQWTARTGLRIEESLRLKWADIHWRGELDAPDMATFSVTVQGTKTGMSQATLPLGLEAAGIILAHRRTLKTVRPSQLAFPEPYWQMDRQWRGSVRPHLGIEDTPTATLKALRRSAARYLHVTKGMPLDVVRQYLRHEDVETTMGYLRLTGGYGEEEMRRWL